MKKTITTIIILFFSAAAFSQVKDTTYSLTLPLKNWAMIFSVIRTSGKLSGDKCEDLIAQMQKNLVAVIPMDSVTVKKK